MEIVRNGHDFLDDIWPLTYLCLYTEDCLKNGTTSCLRAVGNLSGSLEAETGNRKQLQKLIKNTCFPSVP